MAETTTLPVRGTGGQPGSRKLARLMKNKWLYLMALPGMLYFIIFKYFPMWGLLISFQEYQPSLGMLGSKWVGFDHFHRFFLRCIIWNAVPQYIAACLIQSGVFLPAADFAGAAVK